MEFIFFLILIFCFILFLLYFFHLTEPLLLPPSSPNKEFMGPNLVNKLRGTNGVIGLLREISNKWERRAPLSPTDARILRELRGIKVVVQPSNLRIFSDDEYR